MSRVGPARVVAGSQCLGMATKSMRRGLPFLMNVAELVDVVRVKVDGRTKSSSRSISWKEVPISSSGSGSIPPTLVDVCCPIVVLLSIKSSVGLD